MSSNVIPMPDRGEFTGSLDEQVKKLAAYVHVDRIRKGKPSSYEQSLAQCRDIAEGMAALAQTQGGPR